MSMGSPGDSPLTDLLSWDRPSEFPQDITLMLLRLKKEFPDEIVRLPHNAATWSSREMHEEGRRYLFATLERRGVDTAHYRSLTSPKPESKRKWWQLWR
jgi:hypothetical protein